VRDTSLVLPSGKRAAGGCPHLLIAPSGGAGPLARVLPFLRLSASPSRRFARCPHRLLSLRSYPTHGQGFAPGDDLYENASAPGGWIAGLPAEGLAQLMERLDAQLFRRCEFRGITGADLRQHIQIAPEIVCEFRVCVM
jgi:hypothetical protein